MAPVEPNRLLIKQGLKAALDSIGGTDDWNNGGVVVTPHPNIETLTGAEGPVFSYQDEDEAVDESMRTFGHDHARMIVSIRGVKKCSLIDPFEQEREAERLFHDMQRAVMVNQSFGITDVSSAVMVPPSRMYIMEGIVGWVCAILTMEFTFRTQFRQP